MNDRQRVAIESRAADFRRLSEQLQSEVPVLGSADRSTVAGGRRAELDAGAVACEWAAEVLSALLHPGASLTSTRVEVLEALFTVDAAIARADSSRARAIAEAHRRPLAALRDFLEGLGAID